MYPGTHHTTGNSLLGISNSQITNYYVFITNKQIESTYSTKVHRLVRKII